jgi:mono/diheme cytochrome c family protein
MARSRRRDLVIVAVALAVAGLAAVGVLVLRSQGLAGGSSVSRGEVIFQSGTDANGDPIPRSSSGTGTMGGGMMGGGMMGAGCATCHGSDGHGRATLTFTSPNITYGNLTDPQGMLMPDGTRGPTYTDAGIMTAVTQGLDPAGSRLDAPMPQWQLTISEWADLLAYLKTLH